METKEKVRKKKKRRKKRYLLKLFFLVVLMVGLYYFLSSSTFDIQKIKVSDNAYYTKEQIISTSHIKTGNNLFFDTVLKDAKQLLLKDPYIKNATLSRKLPATVEIKVEERTEYAAVPYGEEYLLIDCDGLVLRKTDTQPALPLLVGMTVKKMEPGKPLKVEENALLTDTLKMLSAMEKTELYFKKIDISNVIVKAYIYDSLICEGTPENIVAGMDNLNDVLYNLYQKNIKRGVIKVGSDNYFSFSPIVQ